MVEVKRFSVGELAARAGVATSALRFYEANGLIEAERNVSGHRRYRADVLRRVAFIRVAQRIGLSLGEVAEALGSLPRQRTPTRADWNELSSRWLTAMIVPHGAGQAPAICWVVRSNRHRQTAWALSPAPIRSTKLSW